MDLTKALELFDAMEAQTYPGNLETVDTQELRKQFLEAIKPRDLSVKEHNARGAAELIRHLAQNTARDYPKAVIDQWVRKLDAYADALLDGKEIPKVINMYDVAFEQIFAATAKGQFQDLPPESGFDTLVGLICDWLAKLRFDGVALYSMYETSNSQDNCEVEPWEDLCSDEQNMWHRLAEMVQP